MTQVDTLLKYWTVLEGESFTCEPLSDRNFVFRVTGAAGQAFILKEAGTINPQGDVERKLLADTAVLRHLSEQGVPVSLPVPSGDGQPFARHEGHYYTLSPVLPCDWNLPAREDRLTYNMGLAIARLHKALAVYPGPIYSWTMDLPPRILDEAVPVILRHLDAAGQETLRTVIEAIRAPVTDLLSGLPAQHVHGDCHGGNVLRVGEEVTGFIDIDHLPYGPRIWDVSYYLADYAIHRFQNPVQSEEWFEVVIPNFIKGYEHESPLTEAEKDAVPYLMLGYLLILVAWLFEPADTTEWAKRDLELFYWIQDRMERVRASIP